MTRLDRRLAALPSERRDWFVGQVRTLLDEAVRRGPTPRRETGPAPLSLAQRRLWTLEGHAPGQSVTPLWMAVRVSGRLEETALRDAMEYVAARHDALRTTIVPRGHRPMQVVTSRTPIDFATLAVPAADHDHSLAGAWALARSLAIAPFDLAQAPLWRVRVITLAPGDQLIVVSAHPLILDARSLDRVWRELAQAYGALAVGLPPSLPPVAISFPDYAVWEHAHLDRMRRDRKRADDLARRAAADWPDLPTDRARPDTPTDARAQVVLPIEPAVCQAVAAFSRVNGVDRLAVLLSAFSVLMQRLCAARDVLVGTVGSRHLHADCASVVGGFLDITTVRADGSGDPSFKTLVNRLSTGLADADAAADELPSPSVTVLLSLDEPRQPVTWPGLTTVSDEAHFDPVRADQSWWLRLPDDPGAPGELRILFNPDLFDPDTVIRWGGHFKDLLNDLLSAPDAPVSAADMLGPTQKAFLDTMAQGPSRAIVEATIVEVFEAAVARDPNAPAVLIEGQETRYGDLDSAANRLASVLKARGVSPGQRVGICLRRTLDVPVAVLAILKTGAAYVPLDAAHPASRVAQVAADADLAVIVAHSDTRETLREVAGPILWLDATRDLIAQAPANAPPLAARPGDVAYIIYTSGSTGKPKGVLIEHRSVVHFIQSARDLFNLSPDDRVLGFASITFDVSVFEMFAALLNGAVLCLATDDERLSIDRLQDLMERARISVIDLPPTVMTLLAPEAFEDLRIVFVGGEAFSGELVNRWKYGRRFFNGYGPTECTVTMIVEECHGTWDTSPPIGLPMANHVAHVLDRDLRQVPVGVPGELVIGGAGLARGYLGQPELTAQKFIPDPFGTAPGGRLYRTGDVVKRLPDGRLLFLGRLDQQVKIRGFRIELGDVESAMATFSGIGQARARAWTDPAGEKHLVGYVTGLAETSVPALREHLVGALPAYMVPTFFVVVDELPLTSSGKVDWARLPSPEPIFNRLKKSMPDRSDDPVRTADHRLTSTERIVLEDLVAPILGAGRLGVRDDFFLAGGNSLQTARLMSAVKRRFAVEIPLSRFFVTPTITHLASLIDAATQARQAPIVRLEPADGRSEADPCAGARGRAAVILRSPAPPRLILLHPSSGHLFSYLPLVRALAAGFGVAGIAADPRDATLDPAHSLVTIATRIAHEVRAMDLPEPLCLAGWSYGGVLAFEVARQLERWDGRRPAVVLVDAAHDEDPEPLGEATVRRRFLHDVARLVLQDDAAARVALGDASLTAVSLRDALSSLGVNLEITNAELDERFSVFRTCALGLAAYSPPGSYGGPVSLLAVAPEAGVEAQWRAVCSGPFSCTRIAGDHYTVFEEPALSPIVQAIEQAVLG
jgi:amino acid adenylation domain-containing protein